MSEAQKGEKGNNFGKKHSPESLKKMSNATKGEKNGMYGKTHSKETKEKMREKALGRVAWNKGKSGKPLSSEAKRKLRLLHIKNIESNYGNPFPNYNKKACEYFRSFDENMDTQGKYAMYGGGEYYIEGLGYWVDYFNKDLKIIMEWDEERHFVDGRLSDKDIQRQSEIQKYYPDYEFIRIREIEYLSEKVS